MATDLQPQKPATPKHEVFVELQLARVSKRLHAVEVGKALLLLLVATLVYGLGMALFDLWAGKEPAIWISAVRLGAMGIYLLAALYFGGLVVVRLYRQINPYYVARQIEETIPDAKNSVVNWLDLRREKLPPVIKNALGLRAARDIKTTDPEKAVNAKNNWLLAGLLVGLILGMMVLFIMGPNQFGSLMRRAFLPFGDFALSSRTQITLIQPKEGDVTVPLQRKVDFRAQVSGYVPRVNSPQAARLLYRYHQGDVFVALPLQEEADGSWTASLLPDQVQNGFWYKVAAGDAETPEYQVRVRSLPQVQRFEITYHYRPYLRLPDHSIAFPNQDAVYPRMKGHRGTEVSLLVRTNRHLLQGNVEMDSNGNRKDLLGEIVPEDAQAFRVTFPLEKSGQFRVRFLGRDGEENSDRSFYPLEVLPDLVPNVVLKNPGKDVSLPANGTLPLEGFASDDFGIKNLTLRLRVLEGPTKPVLEPKVYRPEKPFQFADGSYPDHLEYHDFLALEKIKADKGQPFALRAGMVLQYWLEATDNCDYPDKNGNVGASETFKIAILDPQDEKKQKEDRKKAEQERQKQNQKQDQDLKKQEETRKQEQKDNAQPSPEEQKKAEDLQDKAKRLQKEIEKQQQKGEAKGDEPAKAEEKQGSGEPPNQGSKDSAEKKPNPEQTGQKKEEGPKKSASGKDEPQAGQSKDGGPKEKNKSPDAGQSKGPGQEQPPNSEAKGQEDKKEPGSAQQKVPQEHGEAKEQPRDSSSQAKDQGSPSAKEKPGTAKDAGTKSDSPQQNSEAKGQKTEPNGPSPQAKSEKNEPNQGSKENTRGETKPGTEDKVGQAKDSAEKGHVEPGQAKEAGPGPENQPSQAKGNAEPENKATSKSSGGKSSEQNPEAAQAKGQKSPGNNSGQSKTASPQQAKEAGQRKEETLNPGPAEPGTKAQEPTLEDIARLKDQMKKGGPKGEEGWRELEKVFKDSKDPEVRKAAEEALKESGRSPESVQEPANKQGNSGTAQSPGKGQETGSPNEKGQKGKSDQFGKPEPGGQGVAQDPRAKNPDAEAAHRGGNLNLEDLKKKVTPDILKKAGISEKDWQQFLKDAQAYEEMLRRHQKVQGDPSNQRGGSSYLPSTGPQLLNTQAKTSISPLQSGRGQPPPGFRDTFNRWTNRNLSQQEKK